MQDEEPHRAAPQQPRQPGADGPARPASAHGRHVAMQIAMTIRRRSDEQEKRGVSLISLLLVVCTRSLRLHG
jgi:hypothetical protein